MTNLIPTGQTPRTALVARAGLGLKAEHVREILESTPAVGFFEVHAENYMVAGGPSHHYLTKIREDFALSVHGVGLSIGGEAPLDPIHLKRLKILLDRYQPEIFSEHLAWSSHGQNFYNDLLPLAYTDSSLHRVCQHIDVAQSVLKRRILLENPATYVEFNLSTWQEADFISEIIRRTGCGLLLDVNNAYISAINHQRDPLAFIDALPLAAVGEIHLAGFAEDIDAAGTPLLIDHHGSPVSEAVWALYQHSLNQLGPTPTLLERDQNIPPFAVLLAEIQIAEQMMAKLAQPSATLCMECP